MLVEKEYGIEVNDIESLANLMGKNFNAFKKELDYMKTMHGNLSKCHNSTVDTYDKNFEDIMKLLRKTRRKLRTTKFIFGISLIVGLLYIFDNEKEKIKMNERIKALEPVETIEETEET